MGKNRAKKIPIASTFKRREVLGFIGGTVAVSLAGCSRGLSKPTNTSQELAANPACVIKPQQTEGPYFVEERLNRSDIRSDPADGSVQPGVPLQVVFRVSQVGDRSCTPLKGAIVDVWHCNALGVYSDVSDPSFNTVGKKFLRGYQLTDAQGMAQFVTIYPGWYQGRTVHVHFKIRTATSEPAYEFTSQLYFDDALSDRIHAQPPYADKGQGAIKNNQDGIFRRSGGEQLLLQLTPEGEGYIGTFDIGLAIA